MTESDLRWSLRQLPKEAEPQRDLWPDIAARIRATADAPSPRRARKRVWAGALAAALALLALGIGRGWQHDAADPQALMAQQQVEAMAREYDAALGQLPSDAEVPATLAPGLRALDVGAAQIRLALQLQPDDAWLIAQLQHTYALRLQLTQRALQG